MELEADAFVSTGRPRLVDVGDLEDERLVRDDPFDNQPPVRAVTVAEFGPVELHVVSLPGPKQRVVLATLAAEANRVVSA